MRRLPTLSCVALACLLGGCAAKRPPAVPADPSGYVEQGIASWYGRKYHGRLTASGERYDMHELTAAHRTLPFGVRVEVTHRENRRRVIVRINDRGPFKAGRIIDLSYAAARELAMLDEGLAPVRIVVLPRGGEGRRPAAEASP